MAKITTFTGYKGVRPHLVPKPVQPVDPYITSVRDAVPIECPGFQGVYLPIVYPSNPNAPSKNLALSLLYMPPHVGGQSGPNHNERTYLILEGQGQLTCAACHRVVKKGDFIFLPSGTDHAFENTGGEMLVILVAIANPGPAIDHLTKSPDFIGYETHESPIIGETSKALVPNVLSVRDGIPVKYGGCGGLGIRVIHPVNPKAPAKEMGLVIVYLPPHTEIGSGSHEPEENYVVLEGQGRMNFSNFERDVKKGDFVHLPPWCSHGFKNTSSETCVVLVATAPPNP